jgi:hypothetical protein
VAMDNGALVAHHKNGGESSHKRGDSPLCFNCGKPGHYGCNCWKRKDNNRERAHKASVKDDDEDQAFMASHGDALSLGSDWIMDSGATKHMSPHRAGSTSQKFPLTSLCTS